EELSNEITTLQQKLAQEQELFAEQEQIALQMRKQMESEATRVREFTEELDNARQQRDQDSTKACRREEALTEQLDAVTKQSERSLAELAAARQLETEQNQQQIEALAKKLQEAGEKLATANSNEKELSAFSGQLEQERDTARSDTVQLNTELDQLRDELEKMRCQGEHQGAELTEALQKLQQQSEDFEAERERQQGEWRAQSEVSQQQCQDLVEDCKRSREERDAACSQLDNESQELEGLRQRVVALETEGKGDFLVLREQAETAKEQAHAAMQEMEQSSMEYRSMKVELGIRQDQEAALRAEIETIKAREVKLAAKLRERMLADGTEPVFDDEDPGDSIEDQLREQVERLEAELEAARESLSTADIDLQVREQVLQSELDEMLSQADSELNEVTQQLEEAQQQLESAAQEKSKEETNSEGVKGPAPAENQAPGDAQASAQGSTSAIPEQLGVFEYIKEKASFRSRRLSIGGMFAIGVGLVVWFLVRSSDDVMAPDQKDSGPASQTLLVESNTSSAMVNEAKSAAKEDPSTIQSPEQSTQDEGVKANLTSGFSEFVDKVEVKITRLRDFLIQNTQMEDKVKQPEPDEKPTAIAKPTARASPPLKSTASRATRVTRGREVQDRLSDSSAGPVLVQIPHGSFGMGGSDSSLFFNERPQHSVRVREFAIGKYEVRFAEYDRFAESTGRELPKDQGWGRGDQPVINVSWHDAVAYTHWLSEQTGYRYRLPSEAEWEYVARAGTISPHWWNRLPPNANCFDCGGSWAGVKVAPVGRFHANPFGLYDTAGNVAEWTQDCYYPNYKGAPNDGSARLEVGCNHRVVRGGDYSTPLSSVRSTKRVKQAADSKLDTLGFRVVREP
ncbi:MAG: SUMF1/EgtB/PvdO family nonheme iron enzyme, partial [Gammaproteobacteria bacterium]